MPEKTIIIDPKADTIIVFRNPRTEIAVWEEEDYDNTVGDDPGMKRKDTGASDLNPQPRMETEDLGTFSTSPPAEKREGKRGTNSNGEVSNGPAKLGPEIHYHVSSSNLRLASRVFDNMLSDWKEATPNSANGYRYIDAEDCDEEAFLILLNIFHSRSRQVPRFVSLEMLAKIAVLVDYYACEEAVELYSERWVDYLRNESPVPNTLNRNLMLWMFVAWVLKLSKEFTKTTGIAILGSTREELPTLGLPIIAFVDGIDSARLAAIESIVTRLDELYESYRSPQYSCPTNTTASFQCGSILYGALAKQMDEMGLLTSQRAPPYEGTNLLGLKDKVSRMKHPVWYHEDRDRHSFNSYSQKGLHQCNLQSSVKKIVDPMPQITKGLELGDFIRGDPKKV